MLRRASGGPPHSRLGGRSSFLSRRSAPEHCPQDADEEQGRDRPMEPDPVQPGEDIDQDQKARNGEGQCNRARQVRQPVRGEARPRGWRCNGFRPGRRAFVGRHASSSVDSAAHRHAIAGHGSDVLHRLLAETVEADGQLVVHLVVDGAGDDDATGLGKFLQPRRDVDPVAIDVGALHHHVAQVDADAKPHAMRLGRVRILVGNFLLDLDRALHGLDDAGELGDHGVAPGIHDPPVMARHQSGNGGAVAAQRANVPASSASMRRE